MTDADQFALDIMDLLQSPILTHSQMWADSIPERFRNIIPMERMKMALQKKHYAGNAETACFIMTRTFEAPMDSDWTDIYTYVACSAVEIYFQEDRWEAVKAPRTLTEYQEKYLLMPLRLWIYKRRREHLKAKMKQQDTMAKNKVNLYQKGIDILTEHITMVPKEKEPEINESSIMDAIMERAKEATTVEQKHKLWQEMMKIQTSCGSPTKTTS